MARTALILLLAAATARGEQLEWDLEGFPSLLEAAAQAKKAKKRILVGLSGAPT